MEQNLHLSRIGTFSKKDFESDQEIRWCPGCGDYAILASVQKILPELEIPKENFVFVSGIGCASRLPYYMSTYGFHTIHGRAPTIATGLKIMRPELSVWIVTGDGDSFSIGTNHLIHLMRRNIDLTILMCNNQIYGLTKGQYSPTSEHGKITKSSPTGSIEAPLNPISLVLAANCSFVARAIDVDTHRLQEILKAAALHKGTSFVEIYQNCNVFNDGAFAGFTDRGVRDEHTVTIWPGKEIIFGEHKDKTLKLEHGNVSIVPITATQKPLVYEQYMAAKFSKIGYPEFPVPIGVFRQEDRPRYEELLQAKVEDAAQKNIKTVTEVIGNGSTWWVT